jgi:hypothetical protein
MMYSVLVGFYLVPVLLTRIALKLMAPRIWSRRFIRWGVSTAMFLLASLAAKCFTFERYHSYAVEVVVPSIKADQLRLSASTGLVNFFMDKFSDRMHFLLSIQYFVDHLFLVVIVPAVAVAMATNSFERSRHGIINTARQKANETP